MATVNTMEIGGTPYEIEDTEAREKALVPVVNSDNEITALTSSDGTARELADTWAREKALVPVINSDNEITALTSSDGVARELADVRARSLIQNMDGYSTSEEDTGRVWIDGRKVYKRVVTYEETTIHGASGFGLSLATGIRTLVSHCLYKVDLALPIGEEGAVVPVQGYMPALDAYWFLQTLYVTAGGNLVLWSGGNLGTLRVYGEIYYTKLSE